MSANRPSANKENDLLKIAGDQSSKRKRKRDTNDIDQGPPTKKSKWMSTTATTCIKLTRPQYNFPESVSNDDPNLKNIAATEMIAARCLTDVKRIEDPVPRVNTTDTAVQILKSKRNPNADEGIRRINDLKAQARERSDQREELLFNVSNTIKDQQKKFHELAPEVVRAQTDPSIKTKVKNEVDDFEKKYVNYNKEINRLKINVDHLNESTEKLYHEITPALSATETPALPHEGYTPE